MLLVPVLLIDQALDAEELELVRTKSLNFFFVGLAKANWAIVKAFILRRSMLNLLNLFNGMLSVKGSRPARMRIIRHISHFKSLIG